MNHFENIHMEGPGIGILFSNYVTVQDYPNSPNVTHFINGEYFKNIYIDQFTTAILFDVTSMITCNDLVFNHLIAKTASFSQYGIMNYSRSQNDFTGGVINWERAQNPIAEFSTDKKWDYHYNTYLTTVWAYINWYAPYNATYMTDVATTIDDYNFLIADGSIQWHS
jgi:hypothetical protein